MKIIIIYLSRRARNCQVAARGSVEVERAPTRSSRSASVEFLTRTGAVAINERLGAPPKHGWARWYRNFASRVSRRAPLLAGRAQGRGGVPASGLLAISMGVSVLAVRLPLRTRTPWIERLPPRVGQVLRDDVCLAASRPSNVRSTARVNFATKSPTRTSARRGSGGAGPQPAVPRRYSAEPLYAARRHFQGGTNIQLSPDGYHVSLPIALMVSLGSLYPSGPRCLTKVYRLNKCGKGDGR